MKHLKILTLTLICLIVSCEKEALDTNEGSLNSSISEVDNLSRAAGQNLYPDNEMIIKYRNYMTEQQRQNLRDQYGVTSYKTCECADPNLELWFFDSNSGSTGTIEERVHSAKGDSGVEGTDFNPLITHQGTELQVSFGQPNTQIGRTKSVPNNQNVTIAVLDTGVDYNYFGFDQPFLYNNSQNANTTGVNEMPDYFGWDFVNEDNDPYDEHGHGTSISYLISETLEANNVDFQILPVKVFDEHGQGSYFDILCGFIYATNNTDVDIVNMSFGWYDDQYELLKNQIAQSSKQVLITASAGNNLLNTDITPHYPSGYLSSNIITTTALQEDITNDTNLATFANYGIKSVDLAAQGENIPFPITLEESVFLTGTSYSNAYMSAHAGIYYIQGISVDDHKENTINNTVYDNDLDTIKYSSYIDY